MQQFFLFSFNFSSCSVRSLSSSNYVIISLLSTKYVRISRSLTPLLFTLSLSTSLTLYPFCICQCKQGLQLRESELHCHGNTTYGGIAQCYGNRRVYIAFSIMRAWITRQLRQLSKTHTAWKSNTHCYACFCPLECEVMPLFGHECLPGMMATRRANNMHTIRLMDRTGQRNNIDFRRMITGGLN